MIKCSALALIIHAGGRRAADSRVLIVGGFVDGDVNVLVAGADCRVEVAPVPQVQWCYAGLVGDRLVEPAAVG
jgi:hypothetical protein